MSIAFKRHLLSIIFSQKHASILLATVNIFSTEFGGEILVTNIICFHFIEIQSVSYFEKNNTIESSKQNIHP